MPTSPESILLVDPVSTESVASAIRSIAYRYKVVRVHRPRDALRRLDTPLALLLARWDPACVEPAELVLSARVARQHDAELPIVFFVPPGVEPPYQLIDSVHFLVSSESLQAALPTVVRQAAAPVWPAVDVPRRPVEARKLLRSRLVEEALAATDGNVAAAARSLGVSRPATSVSET